MVYTGAFTFHSSSSSEFGFIAKNSVPFWIFRVRGVKCYMFFYLKKQQALVGGE